MISIRLGAAIRAETTCAAVPIAATGFESRTQWTVERSIGRPSRHAWTLPQRSFFSAASKAMPPAIRAWTCGR